jgi:hypothetical protein
MTTAQKIDQLYEYKIQIDLANLEKSKKIQEISDSFMKKMKDAVPEEVRQEIERLEQEKSQALIDFEAEFGDRTSIAQEKVDELDKQIREEVMEKKETVKSTSGEYMAVFRNGSTTWDTPKLDGYAAAHPEILEFRKTGKPSVAIQKVPGGG